MDFLVENDDDKEEVVLVADVANWDDDSDTLDALDDLGTVPDDFFSSLGLDEPVLGVVDTFPFVDLVDDADTLTVDPAQLDKRTAGPSTAGDDSDDEDYEWLARMALTI